MNPIIKQCLGKLAKSAFRFVMGPYLFKTLRKNGLLETLGILTLYSVLFNDREMQRAVVLLMPLGCIENLRKVKAWER